jgi:hypothetical protein
MLLRSRRTERQCSTADDHESRKAGSRPVRSSRGRSQVCQSRSAKGASLSIAHASESATLGATRFVSGDRDRRGTIGTVR